MRTKRRIKNRIAYLNKAGYLTRIEIADYHRRNPWRWVDLGILLAVLVCGSWLLFGCAPNFDTPAIENELTQEHSLCEQGNQAACQDYQTSISAMFAASAAYQQSWQSMANVIGGVGNTWAYASHNNTTILREP